MGTEFFGAMSGILVIASAIPYAIRTLQGKITINLVTWALWSFIGLSLLLTYHSSGAGDNIWPAVFGFINPILITVIALKQRYRDAKVDEHVAMTLWSELSLFDRLCLALGVTALALWLYIGQDEDLQQISLSFAVLADLCAAIPTVIYVWRNPLQDRPFAWTLFGIGYLVSFAAIPEVTFSNLLVPTYMSVMAALIALPLIRYRIQNKLHFMEWI